MTRASIFLLSVLVFSSWTGSAFATSRENWITGFKREFPKLTCQEGQFFRTFYQTTEAQCREKMTEATEFCIAQEMKNLPDEFLTVDQGRHWGEVIGKCAGARFAQIVPMTPKGLLKLLPKSMWSPRVIGFGVGIAIAFFLMIGLVIFLVVRSRKKKS